MSAMTGRRLIVTTIVRSADPGRDSGFVYDLDAATGTVLGKFAFPESAYRSRDPNPRGGLRGVRGVAVHEDRVVVANTERLLLFDLEGRPIRNITHPWFGGIHDLHADPEGIWVCCTNADLLAKVSWEGEIIADWEWRRQADLRAAFRLPRLPPVDRTLDYRDPRTMLSGVRNLVHLNGVAPARDSGLVLSFGRVLSPARYRRARFECRLGAVARRSGPVVSGGRRSRSAVRRIPGSSSAIVRLRSHGRTEILAREKKVGVPNHNVWLEGRSLLYNDSNSGRLTVKALDGRGKAQAIPIPGKAPFVRGLARVDATTFLVGSQGPATVHRIDLRRAVVTDTFPLGECPAEAVFAIRALPEGVAPPSGLSK